MREKSIFNYTIEVCEISEEEKNIFEYSLNKTLYYVLKEKAKKEIPSMLSASNFYGT